MGDPKRPKNVFKKPRRPWTADQLTSELQTVGTFGLRNKRELWKAQTELSRIRKLARALLALPEEVRRAKENELLGSLSRMGLVHEGATLDDVLNLTIETLLERRLQSVVMKHGFAKSPYQARQAVVHGHISISGRIVNIPSYMVRRDEEKMVAIAGNSSYKPSSTVVVSSAKDPAAETPGEAEEEKTSAE